MVPTFIIIIHSLYQYTAGHRPLLKKKLRLLYYQIKEII